MVTLICMVCACFASEATRSFSREERGAFDTLFGTHSFAKITEIAERPTDFWFERKEYLNQATIPHEEFCAIYTQKAQEFLTKKIAHSVNKPWFQNIDLLEEVLQRHLAPSEPFYTDLRLHLYTLACDFMHLPSRFNGNGVATEQGTGIMLTRNIQAMQPLVSSNLQKKKKWFICPSGKFAIFDSMVMRHQGDYLCAAQSTFENWLHFKSHYGLFYGCRGVVNHDNLHAERQENIANELFRVGISAQEHFNACYSPIKLVTHNLIGLCQQTLGCFCNFHEEPATLNSFIPGDKQSLLFPTGAQLTDEGFLDIVPCFSHVPPDHDWKKKPLPFTQESMSKTHDSLLRWRNKYCSAGLKFL